MSRQLLTDAFNASKELQEEFETLNLYILYVTGGDLSQLTA